MKKVLITGSQGQLGKAINEYYQDDCRYELINTDVAELDITDEKKVMDMICKCQPDVIINLSLIHI